MASTPSFTFFCCYLLVVPLLVGFLFQQVSWCSQLPPTCLSCWNDPSLGPTLVFSQLQVLLSHHLIFECPVQFLVSNLHICWNTVGCLLCFSEDQLGVSPMCRGKWTLLLPISPPSSLQFFKFGENQRRLH